MDTSSNLKCFIVYFSDKAYVTVCASISMLPSIVPDYDKVVKIDCLPYPVL